MSMIWLVDAGNTSIKLQQSQSENIQRFDSVEQLISESSCAPGDKLVLASVRTQEEGMRLQAWCVELGVDFVELSYQSTGMLPTTYEAPDRLGIDRLIAATEAHEHFGNCLVVDVGTAVTFDFASGGVHHGGFILPGIKLMCGSLRVATARAGVEQDLEMGEAWRIPAATIDAVHQGAVHAIVAQIEYHARHWHEEHVTICLTGGDAKLVGSLLSLEHQLYPSLVLDGIERLALKN